MPFERNPTITLLLFRENASVPHQSCPAENHHPQGAAYRRIHPGRDSAIAKQTMMNESTFHCYAVTGKKLVELPYAMSAETDVTIELWKYDPRLLSTNGMVDPFSLMMIFEDENDERIQMTFEELLEQLWEQ